MYDREKYYLLSFYIYINIYDIKGGIFLKKHSFYPMILLTILLPYCTSCQLFSGSPRPSDPPAAIQTSDQIDVASFDSDMESLFQKMITSNTLNLHFMLEDPASFGITEYPLSLGEYTDASIAEDRQFLQQIRSLLTSYDYSSLSASQKLTYDIVKDFCDLSLEAVQYTHYEEPLDPLTGTQAQLPVLLAEYDFHSTQDVEDYLSLLSSVDNLFDQIDTYEAQRSQEGLFMADYAATDIIDQCQDFCDDPSNNYLISTFEDRLNELDLPKDTAKAYLEQNNKIVTTEILPSYQKMIQTLTSLLGTGKNKEGLCHFPKGKDYYKLLVRQATGSDDSIHELEQRIETRRKQDLTAIHAALLADKDLAERTKDLTFNISDPSNALEKLRQKMTADFLPAPDLSYEVHEVDPSLSEHLSPAFYLTAPLDNAQKNRIYINPTSGYSGLRLYTTLAHEGFPGHMYQTYIEHNSDLPHIRSCFSHPGYSEGWATYVELLSYQYADLDSKLADVLSKDQSSLLSLYATCDLKIHYDGWSLKDVSEFLARYQITDSDTICEIYHLIVETPANYLSYYVGYLEWIDLQKEYQKKAGTGYSNASFHSDALKLGSAPFYILKKYLLYDH